MSEKLEHQMKAFRALDAKKQAQVSKGTLSQDAYDKWRQGQLLNSKWMRSMIQTCSAHEVETNKKAAEIIIKHLPDIFDESYYRGAFDISKKIKSDKFFTLHSQETIETLASKRNELLPKPRVNIPKDKRWNKNKMRSALTQGVLQGESVDKIAGRFRDVADMNRRSAIRNARTMTMGAQNAGNMQSYMDAAAMGVPVVKMWEASLDGRTRTSHALLDGVTVPLEAKFPNGLMYPADPEGDPADTYNCRCRLSCQIEGFETDPSDLTGRANKLDGMTYEEWKGLNNLKGSGGGFGDGATTTKHIGTLSDMSKISTILNNAEKKLRNLNHEEMIVVTADGKIWHCIGGKNEVSTAGISSSMKGAYSYHNHPKSETFGSFGAKDVASFLANQEKVSMASDYKYVYTMTRTANTQIVEYDMVVNSHNSLYITSLEKVDEYKGDPDMDVYHETLIILSERYGFKYERKKAK